MARLTVGQVVRRDSVLRCGLQKVHGTGQGGGLGAIDPLVPGLVVVGAVFENRAGVERDVVQQGFVDVDDQRWRQTL
ncbi:hypothetical protein D3C76_1654610 [compost metagenome]